MDILCKIYDKLFVKLVKCFDQFPKATYWRVSLSERTEYADGILLAKKRGEQEQQKRVRTFSP